MKQVNRNWKSGWLTPNQHSFKSCTFFLTIMYAKCLASKWACVCSFMSNSLKHHGSGYSVHGISQARILEWVAISFSRWSFQPRDGTSVSCLSWTGKRSIISLPLAPPGKPSMPFVVQSPSRVWLFETPWTAGRQASLSLATSWSLPKFMTIESMMPSNHPILCHPLLLLPSTFPSINVFSNESAFHIRWSKCWNFSFSISPCNVYCIQGRFPLRLTSLISLLSRGLSRVFFSMTVRKHQFFGALSSLRSSSHIHTWLLEEP